MCVPDKRIIVYFELRGEKNGFSVPRKQKLVSDEICCPPYGGRYERLSYKRCD